MSSRLFALTFAVFISLLPISSLAQNEKGSGAGGKGSRPSSSAYARMRIRGNGMVAYDAKDKRYYSVAWAKAHHMKDKGGDTLILIRKSKLPRDAKMSRAMHGKM